MTEIELLDTLNLVCRFYPDQSSIEVTRGRGSTLVTIFLRGVDCSIKCELTGEQARDLADALDECADEADKVARRKMKTA